MLFDLLTWKGAIETSFSGVCQKLPVGNNKLNELVGHNITFNHNLHNFEQVLGKNTSNCLPVAQEVILFFV